VLREEIVSLEPGPNGWLYGYADPWMIREAERRLAEGDRHKPNHLRNVGSPHARKQGIIAEFHFADLLSSWGVSFIHDGGVNPNPDFVIEGETSVAVKSCGSTGDYQPHYRVYVFRSHLQAEPDEWFFAAHEKRADRHVLLGGISHQDFLEQSYLVEAGGEVSPGFIAIEDAFVIPADILCRPVNLHYLNGH
jgi:hypothetical protein